MISTYSKNEDKEGLVYQKLLAQPVELDAQQ